MTDEEKKAFKELVLFPFKYTLKYEDDKSLEIIRNLIINHQKEIDNLKEIEEEHKKENGQLRTELNIANKIIDKMAEFIDTELSSEHLSRVLGKEVLPLKTYRKDIKQYFKIKVKENKE